MVWPNLLFVEIVPNFFGQPEMLSEQCHCQNSIIDHPSSCYINWWNRCWSKAGAAINSVFWYQEVKLPFVKTNFVLCLCLGLLLVNMHSLTSCWPPQPVYLVLLERHLRRTCQNWWEDKDNQPSWWLSKIETSSANFSNERLINQR